jgi:hypothetical protein
MYTEKLNISNQIERKGFKLLKLGKNFSMILFLDGASINLEEAQEIISLKETMYEVGEEMVVLVKSEGLMDISKEAMNLLSDHATPDNVIVSSALIVENLGLRLVANFFINAVKPKYPAKVFRTDSKAVDWSQRQLELYKNSITALG